MVVQVMADISPRIMPPRWKITASSIVPPLRFEVIAELLAGNLVLGSKGPTPDNQFVFEWNAKAVHRALILLINARPTGKSDMYHAAPQI
jgi:hypothetical protein